MAILEMGPNGVPTFAQGAPGSSANFQGSRPAGDQGKGYQISYSTTFAAITGSVTDTILVPPNARDLSLTYSYNGAATVTFAIQGCNNTRDEIKAGNGVFGTFPNADVPSILGGTANSTAVSVALPSAPMAIRGIVGGTGTAGGDTIIVNLSCVATIRP